MLKLSQTGVGTTSTSRAVADTLGIGTIPVEAVVTGSATFHLLGRLDPSAPWIEIKAPSTAGYLVTLNWVPYIELEITAGTGTVDLWIVENPATSSPPAAPSYSLTAASGGFTLTYTDGANNGSAITAHPIWVSSTSGFTPSSATLYSPDVGASPYAATGFAPGQTIYIRFGATNSSGTTIAAEQSVTPSGSSPTPPAAPTYSLVATVGGFTLTYTDGSTGGAPITAHPIWVSTTSGFTPGPGNLYSSDIGASPYSPTGFTAGQTVYIRLGATNSVGTTIAAEQSVTPAAPPPTPPAAPTYSLAATVGGFTLTYTDGSTGGAPITAHPIWVSTTSGFTPGPGNLYTADTGASPYSPTGFTAGQTVYVRFGATNSAGTTIAAEQSVTPAAPAPTPPGAPTYSLAAKTGGFTLTYTDGSTGGAPITAHPIWVSTTSGFTPGPGNLYSSDVGASPYGPTGFTAGQTVYIRFGATNSAGTTIAAEQSVTPTAAALPTPAIATMDGDSRTHNSGGRGVASGSLSIASGMGAAYNMAGLIQMVLGNSYIFEGGFMHARGASTTLAQYYRMQSSSIAAAGGNPAFTTTNVTADNDYSIASDGAFSELQQGGKHAFSASVSVNDGTGTSGSFYNNPQTAWNTLRTIANIADLYGNAGMAWYTGCEFCRGDTLYPLEHHTVSAGTWTATNIAHFVDGDSFSAVGVVGAFADGTQRVLTKVSSAPGQDQYTVTTAGVYVAGGTAPTDVYITYNATPAGGRVATSDFLRIVHEFMNSSAANYVSTINSVNYGIPGLLYNRPLVRIFDTWTANRDPSSGSSDLPLPGTFDNLQLHGTMLLALRAAKAALVKWNADYPSAPRLDYKPTRNNWYAVRGIGTTTAYSGTLPPTMRTGFVGFGGATGVPTLIALNGTPVAAINPSTGAINAIGGQTAVVSGTLNWSTGLFSITVSANASFALNAVVWFEQDIGNGTLAFNAGTNTWSWTEGTIGRNPIMNGMLDITAAVGGNLTVTTGTSSISTITNAQVPYGATLIDAAMAAAVSAGTATVIVSTGTDDDGYPSYNIEAYGTHTGNTALAIKPPTMANFTSRVGPTDKTMTGCRLAYKKSPTKNALYGVVGGTISTFMNTGSVTVASSSGSQTITGMKVGCTDGGSLTFVDSALLAEAGGKFDYYRISPRIDMTPYTPSSVQTGVSMATQANYPFAYRLETGRLSGPRRRNDVVVS